MPREPMDLDDDRPRRAKPAGGVPVWAWVLMAGAAVVVLGCAGMGVLFVGCMGVREAADDVRARHEAEDAAKTDVIDAAKLFEDYKGDGAKAAARYAGKVLRVRLRVDKATQQYGTLQLRQDMTQLDRVYADIPLKDASRASVGTVVVVRGKVVSSGGGDVRLGDCLLE